MGRGLLTQGERLDRGEGLQVSHEDDYKPALVKNMPIRIETEISKRILKDSGILPKLIIHFVFCIIIYLLL